MALEDFESPGFLELIGGRRVKDEKEKKKAVRNRQASLGIEKEPPLRIVGGKRYIEDEEERKLAPRRKRFGKLLETEPQIRADIERITDPLEVTREEFKEMSAPRKFAEIWQGSVDALTANVLKLPTTLFRVGVEMTGEERERSLLAPSEEVSEKLPGADLFEMREKTYDWIHDKLGEEPLEKSKDFIDFLDRSQLRAMQPIQDEKPGLSSISEYASTMISGGFSVGESYGLTMVARRPGMTGLVLGLLEGSDEYNRCREAGKGPSHCRRTMIRSIGVTTLLETAQSFFYLAENAGSILLSTVLSGVPEMTTENMQTIAQNLVAKYGYDGAVKWHDHLWETTVGTVPAFGVGAGVGRQQALIREEAVQTIMEDEGVSREEAADTFQGYVDLMESLLVANGEKFGQPMGLFTDEVSDNFFIKPESVDETLVNLGDKARQEGEIELAEKIENMSVPERVEGVGELEDIIRDELSKKEREVMDNHVSEEMDDLRARFDEIINQEKSDDELLAPDTEEIEKAHEKVQEAKRAREKLTPERLKEIIIAQYQVLKRTEISEPGFRDIKTFRQEGGKKVWAPSSFPDFLEGKGVRTRRAIERAIKYLRKGTKPPKEHNIILKAYNQLQAEIARRAGVDKETIEALDMNSLIQELYEDVGLSKELSEEQKEEIRREQEAMPERVGKATLTELRAYGEAQEPAEFVRKRETTLLKDKLKIMERTARETERFTREQIIDNQSELIDALMELPMDTRGHYNLLTDIKEVTDKDSLQDAIARVQEKVRQVEEAERLSKRKGEKRSLLSFIRLVGNFNQTAVNHAKDQLEIEGSVYKMSMDELTKLTNEMIKRLNFKRRKGFDVTISDRDAAPPEMTEEVYEENVRLAEEREAPTAKNLLKRLKKAARDPQKGIKYLTEGITSRLEKLAPPVARRLREHEFNVFDKMNPRLEMARNYIRSVHEMSDKDQADWDLALKNRDRNKIDQLMEKYDMKGGHKMIMQVLNAIYQESETVYEDMGFLPDYFPRFIDDYEGLVEHLKENDKWGPIEEAFKRKRGELGNPLSAEERRDIINKMVRGFSSNHVYLSKAGPMKERRIDRITPEMNEFYKSSDEALIDYIVEMTDKIETRKFFGKYLFEGKDFDPFDVKEYKIDGSIGTVIEEMMKQEDFELTLQEESELRDILQARFGKRPTSKLIRGYKNLAYAAILPKPSNAITQITDLVWSAYKEGVFRTTKEAAKALIRQGRLTKEDVRVANIVYELPTTGDFSKMLNKTLKASGFTLIDRIGKEALINSTLVGMVYKAQSGDEALIGELREELNRTLGEDARVDQAIKDLENDTVTKDVKLHLFNVLADYHPITPSEMPQAYLENPNGRIFYMFQSYTVAKLDTYRREVIRQMQDDPKEGLKNMVRLTFLLYAAKLPIGVIKDFLLGKKIKPKEIAVDAFLDIIMLSRYDIRDIGRKGMMGALWDRFAPPTRHIEDFGRDIWNIGEDLVQNYGTSIQVNDMRSFRNLPVVGKLYYWWFGPGREYIREQEMGGRGGRETLFPEGLSFPEEPSFPGGPSFPEEPSFPD